MRRLVVALGFVVATAALFAPSSFDSTVLAQAAGNTPVEHADPPAGGSGYCQNYLAHGPWWLFSLLCQ